MTKPSAVVMSRLVCLVLEADTAVEVDGDAVVLAVEDWKRLVAAAKAQGKAELKAQGQTP